MVTVVEASGRAGARPVFLCDFSPPRGPDLAALDLAGQLPADFVSVAYSPGKGVRMDSAMAGAAIRARTGREVVFNLATRDMNRLALQNHLVGAQGLGLENVVIVGGDPFSSRERERVSPVRDYRPTGLVAAAKALNDGIDFKGLRLKVPTSLCIGTTVDLTRDVVHELRLTERKEDAGCDFFMTQAVYRVEDATTFLRRYDEVIRRPLTKPVYWGIQILRHDGLIFGDVPPQLGEQLENGRSGVDIALELIRRFLENGLRTFYLIPAILKGGVRDYDGARALLEEVRGWP